MDDVRVAVAHQHGTGGGHALALLISLHAADDDEALGCRDGHAPDWGGGAVTHCADVWLLAAERRLDAQHRLRLARVADLPLLAVGHAGEHSGEAGQESDALPLVAASR